MFEEHVKLLERRSVEQKPNAFTVGKLTALLPCQDAFLAAAEYSVGTLFFNYVSYDGKL